MSVQLQIIIPDDLVDWLAEKAKTISPSKLIIANLRASRDTEKEMRGYTKEQWQEIVAHANKTDSK